MMSQAQRLFREYSRKQRAPARKQKPMVSVIVPAHNEEAYLAHTLRALRKQRYPRYEVIVVANGCSDNTAAVAKHHCDRLIVISQKGISLSRNLGARMASGELLVFLDADTLLERDGLNVISRQFTRKHAAGTLKARPDPARWLYRVHFFFKNLMHQIRMHKGSVGVIVCWKDYFEAAGGFDEGLHVMENSALIEKMQRFGKYRFIGQTVARTSMRRYEKRGFCRTAVLWVKLWAQSLVGDLHERKYETVR